MSDNIETNDELLDAELQALLDNASAVDDEESQADETDAEGVTADEAVATDEAVEIDLEAIEAEATAAEIRNSAYEEQSAEIATNGDDASTTLSSTTVTISSRAPRVSRAAGAKASSVLTSVMSDEAILKAAMLLATDEESEELVDELKASVDKLAKKVGDKAVNLLRFRESPTKLQNYTRLGLEFLIEHERASSKELCEHLQAQKYTIGTARSQANQLMQLFPALKIAEKVGRVLTLNAESELVKSYREAHAAAAA